MKNPISVSQYRPISLCNVLYKIFSKVPANRLKKFIPELITKHQSAFAKNRLILDNVLVAFETLHCMKNHNSGQTGFMAIKLDMSKAYDRVEWNYLQKLMEKMGFCSRWIGLMLECVHTVSYSILVNGDPKGLINPTRDIRQGDPLSPFLFLLFPFPIMHRRITWLNQKSCKGKGDQWLLNMQKRPQTNTLIFCRC